MEAELEAARLANGSLLRMYIHTCVHMLRKGLTSLSSGGLPKHAIMETSRQSTANRCL